MMKDGKGVFVLEPKDPFDTIKLISFDAEGNFNVLLVILTAALLCAAAIFIL